MIPKTLLNFEIPESKIKIKTRSLQNFAAAIGDMNNVYYDDTLTGGIVAHPCYPLTTTWPIFEQMMPALVQAGLSPQALNKIVHYSENLIHHRPITPNMRLKIHGKIVGITQHPKGTQMHFKLMATRKGNLIFEDVTSIFFRNITVDYPSVILEKVRNPTPDALKSNDLPPIHSITLSFSKTFSYIYDGCTNITFPIHTSHTFAQKVGLPGPIVQGSASFSRCISEIMNLLHVENPHQIQQIAGQFGAIILPEENLQLRVFELPNTMETREIGFNLANSSGKMAIKNGYIKLKL
ncbi:MAG: MaoC/PaaZ C-terminal domain-containing protein [Promethearchaeota archaeon]